MAGVELLETRAGSITLPAPGYDVRVLDENGLEVGPNQEGAIVVKGPLPPSGFPTVWRDHDRYENGYWKDYPGFYLTGDGGYRDKDGYIYVMGRMDDVINVAGHRLSTGQIEEVVAKHTVIAECAVVGINDKEKGQVPVSLIVLKDGANMTPETLERELVTMVREAVGPIANFKRILIYRAVAQNSVWQNSAAVNEKNDRQGRIFGSVNHRRSFCHWRARDWYR